MSEMGWGVVRYLPGSGDLPEADFCSFDGWYAEVVEAKELFEFWRVTYPQWVVALVVQADVHFGECPALDEMRAAKSKFDKGIIQAKELYAKFKLKTEKMHAATPIGTKMPDKETNLDVAELIWNELIRLGAPRSLAVKIANHIMADG